MKVIAKLLFTQTPKCPPQYALTHWGRVTHIASVNKISLVQIMACRLVGTKPLPEPLLSEIHTFLFSKMHL